MSSKPEVLKTEELSAQDAKWVTLQKITWRDEEGKERPWEVASRKTRGEGGIDAVAILAVLRSKSKSFKPSTIIIEQAGLISSGESVEETAIRELEEETGYKASGVAEVSPLLVSDPGMTSANMKLIALNVDVKEGEEPSQKLDEGEHIVKRIIELDNLMEELQVFLLPSTMAYPPHADPDHSRWQRELENLQYINHQLRVDLEDAQGALSQAKQEAAAYRDEIVDLKNKIEVFWDSIEGARAMFVRSFPNYNYRDSHKRSREADERERMSRKAQRLEPPPVAGSSAPGRDRDREGSRRGYPPEAGVAAPYPQEHDYRALPRGQPHLTVPVTQFPYLVAGTDKHAYPNGRSPYDTHPPGPYPDPAHPHVDPTRGHSASPHLATRIPTHPGHRHDPSGYPPDGQGIPTHARRESGDPMMIPRQRRPPMPNKAPLVPLPPAGAIIIHPPAAFQVSFTDLQPGIFLDRSDFGAEYPPNLDPPQGLQAVRCLFCDKHYSGANARSLWRRHVMAQASITSIPGDLHESAPPSAAPAASPPGQSKSKRADGEGEHPESEDEHEPIGTRVLGGLWGDVARWQGQGPVPGKPSAPGHPGAPKPEDEEQTVASHEADRQREWCLCRRPDSWGEMIRCDMPTCAIQWYHLRCVGLDAAAKARDEWICEDCNRKNAQRRQEAHRDGPLSAVQDKDRAPALRTPEPGTSTHQAQNKTSTRPEGRDPSRREQDEDVVMRTTDSNTREQRGNDSNVSDDEPSRGGARKTQARRVLSEPQSSAVAQQGDQRDAPTAATDARSETTPGPTTDDNTRQSESPDQAKAGGTPKKKGWKGYALVPVPDGAEPAPQREYTPQTVTTPGGSRRTRSGKSFFPEDGVSASDGERQQSMETN
ncbi:hypothetical protein RHS01_00835 [Rhizoctonia solani]|uniref:Uncharacterized protein n=1 Tax=Rhizoctonia solani TaxID=456999 RepID=A0A8H7M9P9_9AGAM|nr:hypothetical protein RHS01_00835 [Rhizoctonia solani]